MKKNLFYAILLIGMNFGIAKAQISDLNLEKFVEKIKATPKHQLLDVRTPREWEQGKIASSNCINYQDVTFKDQIKKLDKSQPVFVYCAAGGRSANASKILEKEGFKKIYNLSGAGYSQLAASGVK